MSDSLRTDPLSAPQSPPDGERDVKIESLLLTGLDHYFAAEYEQAIDIWTRALFLDRGHARARAYIERARSALAEQQRESEELLHKGVAALERGEIETARQLLNLAVACGGAHDAALAGLARVNRVAAATHASGPTASSVVRQPVARMKTAAHRSRGRAIGLLFLLLVGAGVGFVLSSWEEVQALLAEIPALPTVRQAEPVPARPVAAPLPVPRSSEAAFDRATALQASGRLYDALRALELVRPTDPLRDDADKLRIEIQRQLLAHPAGAQPGPPAATASPAPGPAAPTP